MSSDKLAVKWRPKKLSDVVGQDETVRAMDGMFRSGKRLNGTYLISGPYGTGKTTLALLFSWYANCKKLVEDGETGRLKPCGKCPFCLEMEAGGSSSHKCTQEYNIANLRGIDDAKAMERNTRWKPIYNYQVIILDECHTMTDQAKSVWLKTLEEPPKSAIIVLCTTHPEKLLPTILSRSQRLNTQKVPAKVIAKRLRTVAKREGQPKLAKDKQTLVDIALASDGHVRDALTTLDSVISAVISGNRKDIFGKDGRLSESILQGVIESQEASQPWTLAEHMMAAILELRMGDAFRVGARVGDVPKFFEFFIRLALDVVLECYSDSATTPKNRTFLANWVAKKDGCVLGPIDPESDGDARLAIDPEAIIEIADLAMTYQDRSLGNFYRGSNPVRIFAAKAITAIKTDLKETYDDESEDEDEEDDRPAKKGKARK